MEMILILGFGALLIFFMMNSRKKQRQQQEKLSSGLVIGARVMTTFGVFGTVVDVIEEENKVSIESGPGTILTVHRQAIGTIEEPVGAADGDLDVTDSVDADRLDDDLRNTEIPDDLSSLTPEDPAADREADAVGAGDDAEAAAGDESTTDPVDATDGSDANVADADSDDSATTDTETTGTDGEDSDSDESDPTDQDSSGDRR